MLGGGIILFSLALANEVTTRDLPRKFGGASITALCQPGSVVRYAHVIEAMEMMPNLVKRWHSKNTKMLYRQARASTRAGAITVTSRFIRQGLQIDVLGAGACSTEANRQVR